MDQKKPASFLNILLQERALLAGWASTIFFLTYGLGGNGANVSPWVALVAFVWLLAAIVGSVFAVVRHADCLAIKLGEPLGTIILTLAVIIVEVMMISALMLSGKGNPTLGRDTMFAVVMIVLCGLTGVTLIIGSWRHYEQSFNLQGAAAYLSLILPLSVIGLILPDFTTSGAGATFSTIHAVSLAILCVAVYGVFLGVQTIRHKQFFMEAAHEKEEAVEVHDLEVRSVGFHTVFLILCLLPVVLLSKKFALVLDFGLDSLHLPGALGGLIVAALILSPEGVGAIRAAKADKLQRAVNLLLGSVLATISLTIPAVLVIGLFVGKPVVLGLEPPFIVLLVLALALSMLTFSKGRTNVLQGIVHLMLFLVYLVLIFEG